MSKPMSKEEQKKRIEEERARTGVKMVSNKEEDKNARQTKEQMEAHLRQVEAEDEQRKFRYEGLFYGETEQHKAWRLRLNQITETLMVEHSPKSRDPLIQEHGMIAANYLGKHFEFGPRIFNKVFLYESVQKDIRLYSEDGKHWSVSELQEGMWVRGKYQLIIKDGKPERLFSALQNEGLYDLLRSGVMADFIIVLVDGQEEKKQ